MKGSKLLQYAVIYFAGLLFAVGLGIAGMTNPRKVIAFLDFFGKWDATLVTVLAAATGVNLLLFRFILKRESPLLANNFFLPTRKNIDGRLLMGAALFGVGWGISGYCPGPAITSVASGAMASLTFVLLMGVGQMLSYQVDAFRQSRKGEGD